LLYRWCRRSEVGKDRILLQSMFSIVDVSQHRFHRCFEPKKSIIDDNSCWLSKYIIFICLFIDYKGGTLVVCPASLIRQWESKVDSKLCRHRLSVCVHHGPNRETSLTNEERQLYQIMNSESETAGSYFYESFDFILRFYHGGRQPI